MRKKGSNLDARWWNHVSCISCFWPVDRSFESFYFARGSRNQHFSYLGYGALQLQNVHFCSFGIRVRGCLSVGAVGAPTVFHKVCLEPIKNCQNILDFHPKIVSVQYLHSQLWNSYVTPDESFSTKNLEICLKSSIRSRPSTILHPNFTRLLLEVL